MTRQILMLMAAAYQMVGCQQPPQERKPYIANTAKLEQVIELPGRGVVHVLRVPTGYMESTRCIVVTGDSGGPAVSCTPKDFDIPAED